MSFKFIFLFFSIFITVNSAYAFDRITCDGRFEDWSVWNGFGKKNKVLFKLRPSILLLENESPVLIVKDETGKSIIEIFPWNGIDYLVKSTEETFKFETDKMSWFELTFTKQPQRKLYCRLTF